jgi:hypothetical protein
LFKFAERFGRSRFGFGGVDRRVLFIPSCPGYTGLTGASHLWDLPLVNFLLTPKFGKESDLWDQLGEKSVQWKEGCFRCIRQKKSAVGYLLPFGKGTVELILRDCTVTWPKRKG